MRRRVIGGVAGVVAAAAITAGAVAVSRSGSDGSDGPEQDPVATSSLPPPEAVAEELPTVPYDPASGILGTTVPVDPDAGPGILTTGGA